MNGTAVPGDVVEITVLKSQPDSNKALELLRKIHSKVKPIMKAHGWVLPTLAEFFPKNPNLLGININRGRKICLRLRPANDPHSFLPLEEELIGTMLHELTHNHRGPHDDVFDKFLDGLWNEYDALSAKGYAGEGFLGPGRRVGEGVATDRGVSLRDARDKALRRIEERDKMRKLLGTGGKLGSGGGGGIETKGRRMGEILADAAERRLKARRGCGGSDEDHRGTHTSGSRQQDLPQEVQDDIKRADEDSRIVVIDLTLDDDDDDTNDSDDFGREEFVVRGKKRAIDNDHDNDQETKSRFGKEESPDLIIVSAKGPSVSDTFHGPTLPKSTTKKKRPVLPPDPRPGSSSEPRPPPHRPPLASSSATGTPASGGWSCLLCTFYNPSPLHLVCSICESERPRPVLPPVPPPHPPPPRSTLPKTMTLKSITGTTKEVVMNKTRLGGERDDVWVCHACAREMDETFWTCRDCGTMKLTS